MTRKAYIVGPNTSGDIWSRDADMYIPVKAGQTVWVDLDSYPVDEDGDVRAFAAFDSDPLDYGFIKFTDLTPVSEVYDSDFNHEVGTGYVHVDGESVFIHEHTTPGMLRDEADYYEKVVNAYRAAADWLEAREAAAANDPVKKAVALINNAPRGANLAEYLIENGVVFP